MAEHKNNSFHRIGSGFCGTVWTSLLASDPNFGYALKREDGGPGRSLLKEFQMQHRVIEALQQFYALQGSGNRLRVLVSQPHAFIAPGDPWWEDNLDGFPAGYSPCNVMRSDRIFPVAKGARETLIEHFCPEPLRKNIKASVANKACLIRPYLGRRRFHETNTNHHHPSRFKAFSLRNFPLHVDQMEILGITSSDMVSYSRAMATSLAVMHWFGEMDANDVEFVLAPPREDSLQSDTISNNNVLGNLAMWVLDFDCCNVMSLDEAGVAQAVSAFTTNDPYYPRPKSSRTLWEAFRDEYLTVSIDILRHRGLGCETLPRTFIEQIEEGREPMSLRAADSDGT